MSEPHLLLNKAYFQWLSPNICCWTKPISSDQASSVVEQRLFVWAFGSTRKRKWWLLKTYMVGRKFLLSNQTLWGCRLIVCKTNSQVHIISHLCCITFSASELLLLSWLFIVLSASCMWNTNGINLSTSKCCVSTWVG